MLVYILSRFRSSYSTSRLKEAIESQGHKVRIIDHTLCELQVGEESLIYYQGTLLLPPDIIIPRIGASATYQGASVIRQFELMRVKTLTPANGLINSRDKLRAMQLMSVNNVPMPITYYSNGVNDWNNITETVGPTPFVIKLLEGTQGLGVFLANDDDVARGLIDSYTSIGSRFMIQQYIEESKGTDVRAFVVGGKVIAAMKRVAPEGEFRSNLHRGGTGNQVELTEEEINIALASAKTFGLEIAGVDILRSINGPLVLEVNSSPGLEGIEKYTNIEVADYIAKYLNKLMN